MLRTVSLLFYFSYALKVIRQTRTICIICTKAERFLRNIAIDTIVLCKNVKKYYCKTFIFVLN